MSTQRYISTSFWDDKWIRSIDPSERYLYMYLLTNPQTNISGIYQITMDRIAFDTGYDERTLRPMFKRFETAGKALFWNEEWVILPSWPKHQNWQDRGTIKKGIDTILAKTPQVVLAQAKKVGYRYPIDSLLVGYTYEPSYSDIDSDIDIDLDLTSGASATPCAVAETAPAVPTKAVAKPGASPLYHAIRQSFLSKTPTFANYAKEAQAIKRVEAFAGRYAPEDQVNAARLLIEKYYQLTESSDKFWHKQPFTPSGLSCLMDRVARELEISRPMTREEAEAAYQQANEIPF